MTKITKANGPLSKKIIYRNGTLDKDSSQCWLNKGTAEKITIDFSKLGDFLNSLKPNQAVTWGITDEESTSIVSRNLSGQHPDAITRTRDYFHYPEQGVIMFDYDADGEPLQPEELIATIRSLNSDFDDVAMLWRTSVSSNIYTVDGKLIDGTVNQRIYVPYSGNPDLIKIWTKALEHAAWKKGLGRIFITKSGQMLPRTIFDTAVFQPERLDFVGPAVTENCKQEYLHEYIPGKSLYFNNLTLDVNNYNRAVELLKRQYAGKARRIKTTFLKDRPDKKSLARALETLTLTPDIQLHFDNLPGPVTVAEVLIDPDTYDGKTLADPLEPEYGKGKAKFFAGDDTPIINSFAHGGRVFQFEIPISSLTEHGLEFLEAVTNDYMHLLPDNLKKSDVTDIKKSAALSQGISKEVANKAQINIREHITNNTKARKTHAQMANELKAEYFNDTHLFTLSDSVYLYDGRIYKKNSSHILRNLIIERFDTEPLCSKESDYKAIVETFLKNFLNEDFKNNYPGIALEDGIYAIENNEIVRRDFSPQVPITTMLPVSLDKKPPEKLLDFLDFAIPGQVELFQEVLGAVVLGVLTPYFHKAILFIGSGANGKSVLIDVIKSLFPKEYVESLSPTAWDKPESISILEGKMLNVVPEMSVSAVIPDGPFKNIVAGDPITLRSLYHNPYTAVIRAANIFASNHMLRLNDASHGMIRRWIVFDFPNVVKEKDRIPKYHKQILKDDRGKIINWAFEGLRRRLKDEKFSLTPINIRQRDKLFIGVDELASFLDDQDTVRTGEGLTQIGVLYQAYLSWRQLAGFGRRGVSFLNKPQFINALVERGYNKVGNDIKGIRVTI